MLGAAPVLLRRRPGSEEVAERSIAVKGITALGVDFAASGLDGAGAANVAIHLHLAVGQGALVALGAEDIVGHPMDSIGAFGGFATHGAGGITLQWRKGGPWAALLEIVAAVLSLSVPPAVPRRGFAGAVELHAAAVFTFAAPVLLGVRPSLHPVGEARGAVVDLSMRMTHAMNHVGVKVVASMPGAWASLANVTAAPALLVVGPAPVPVGESGIAIVVELRTRSRHRDRDFVMRWAATAHLGTTPGRVVNVPGLTPHAVVVARVAIHQRLLRHVPGGHRPWPKPKGDEKERKET